jgi:hypothetical protein
MLRAVGGAITSFARSPDNEKPLLLCRPQGGLNDILCQIELCCRYADRFDRMVIVDTNYNKSDYWFDTFSNYFSSKQMNLILDARPYLKRFETFSVFPPELTGKIQSYEAHWHTDAGGYTLVGTNLRPTFDFSRAYEERMLVHHDAGWNGLSASLGRRISISENIHRQLSLRLQQMGGPYHAVHVRHTDLQSDFSSAILHFKTTKFSKLFVATDNRSVCDTFIQEFGRDRIMTFSSLPGTAGKTLHIGRDTGIAIQTTNTEAILDLFTLACADSLYICKNINNPHRSYSGYSLLAQELNQSPELRTMFLDQNFKSADTHPRI